MREKTHTCNPGDGFTQRSFAAPERWIIRDFRMDMWRTKEGDVYAPPVSLLKWRGPEAQTAGRGETFFHELAESLTATKQIYGGP
ncbi:hypothetical protein AAFF_G00241550 [Aldrovandia affinis]|uniref:Uncharacterized protein n=1 Tax=Aldrovandia affinis TaxID=143900 RepID=A0AAD7SUN4_9TELE|nr:hypothetical protein AAFF_G00241550 [Aldrovandia affinis]